MTPTLLFVSLALGAPAIKEAPKATTLVGRWECTALTVDGKTSDQWESLEYEFTADGKWIIYRKEQNIGGIERTYKANAATKPATLDACERADGTANVGIYKVEGDKLILSLTSRERDRPMTFDPDEGVMTFEFRRVKRKE